MVKFGENSAKFGQICDILEKKTAKNSVILNENFEIRDGCKGAHCVDLGESFPTSGSLYRCSYSYVFPVTAAVTPSFPFFQADFGLADCAAQLQVITQGAARVAARFTAPLVLRSFAS